MEPFETMLNAGWRARNWNRPLLLLALGNLLLFFARRFTGLWIPALILIGGAFICLFRRWKSRKACAVELDRLASAGAHLEAWLETPETHPLSERLRTETAAAYRGFRLPFSLRLFPVCAALWIVSFLPLLFLLAPEPSAPTERRNAGTVDREPKPKPETADFAELALSLPEPELRAKPLDELEWEGVGLSSRGFRSLALVVYVNGVRKKEIAPDEQPKQKGDIRFNGFLALEDFDVKPFDLVSYHLSGIAATRAGERRILSSPQFVEVRPFREDVLTPDMFPGNFEEAERMMDVFNRLSLLLQTQIELNKALFSARILKDRNTAEAKKELQKLYPQLCADQQSLSDELEKFLALDEVRLIPADAVNHLESSLLAMKKALAELKGDSK